MILERWLLPDRMVPTFRDVTPDALRDAGIRFIFSDIDNTLATYDDPEPPENVTRWIRAMEEAGIRVIFVSNNDRGRVERFAAPLGCPAYAKARKPLVGTLRRAMTDAGAGSSSAISSSPTAPPDDVPGCGSSSSRRSRTRRPCSSAPSDGSSVRM